MGDFYKQLEAVNRDWRNFEFIEDKGDERLQKAAINKSGHSLGLMSGLSVDVLVYAAKMYPDDEYVAKYVLSNLSDHSILGDDVLSSFLCINSITGLVKNPSEAVQLAALNKILSLYNRWDVLIDFLKHFEGVCDTFIIKAIEAGIKVSSILEVIKNPSEAVLVAAVKAQCSSSRVFDKLKNPSEAVQLEAVKNNWCDIQYIKNPSEAVQLAAVKNNGYAIQYIPNPSEAVQLAAVKNNGYAIQYIKNPSEAVKLVAAEEIERCNLIRVAQDGRNLKDIKNPSEAVQLAAVKEDGRAIQYIPNPSEAIQLIAVKDYGYAIQYIKNPSEAVQLAAVKNNGYAIQYIKNPSEAVQLEAVKKNPRAISYISSPSEAAQLEAIKDNECIIKYIKNPSEAVQLEAVRAIGSGRCSSSHSNMSDRYEDYIEHIKYFCDTAIIEMFQLLGEGDFIEYIDSPSEAVQLAAVKLSGTAIRFISDPSEEVQIEAIRADWRSIQYIKNPPEAFQLEAVKRARTDGDFIEFRRSFSRYFNDRCLYYYKHGCFPTDEKDEFKEVSTISESFSLSSKQVSLFNKVLSNIRAFLLRRELTGAASLYESGGVVYLTAGRGECKRDDVTFLITNGVEYAYYNGNVSVKGINGTSKEKETAVKFIEGTVDLLCSKVPFSIKKLTFDVSSDPLSSGSMVDSIEEPGSVNIVLN